MSRINEKQVHHATRNLPVCIHPGLSDTAGLPDDATTNEQNPQCIPTTFSMSRVFLLYFRYARSSPVADYLESSTLKVYGDEIEPYGGALSGPFSAELGVDPTQVLWTEFFTSPFSSERRRGIGHDWRVGAR